jgi:hypothetical protein
MTIQQDEGELYGHDFDRCRELERARCAAMPDVSTLSVYDVLGKQGICPSDVLKIMAALGRKCDDENDGECIMDERAWLEEGRIVVKRYIKG